MMKYTRLEHRFVQHIPDRLDPGVLYISMEYGTAAHACCCGCGEEVVTPFTPTDWKMTYDGETVSLYPSIGSWSLPCRSHYVIDRGRVVESLPWTDYEVAAGRGRDKAAKEHHYGTATVTSSPATPSPTKPALAPPIAPVERQPKGMWSRISRWIFGAIR